MWRGYAVLGKECVFYSLSCWVSWWVSVWCHYRLASRSHAGVIHGLRHEAERGGQAW